MHKKVFHLGLVRFAKITSKLSIVSKIVGGQFWALGRLNLLGGQSNLLGGH